MSRGNKKHRQTRQMRGGVRLSSHFFPVLLHKTGKNQPGVRRLSTLNGDFFGLAIIRCSFQEQTFLLTWLLRDGSR